MSETANGCLPADACSQCAALPCATCLLLLWLVLYRLLATAAAAAVSHSLHLSFDARLSPTHCLQLSARPCWCCSRAASHLCPDVDQHSAAVAGQQVEYLCCCHLTGKAAQAAHKATQQGGGQVVQGNGTQAVLSQQHLQQGGGGSTQQQQLGSCIAICKPRSTRRWIVCIEQLLWLCQYQPTQFVGSLGELC